ncbi:VOC family protein [Sphingorhabdus sp.]|jgi:hypothetical protein|uniref:VOC family protein n=1 Tax=Sphingorhabdus sp. TaxID=1902408 RepID=UPI0037C9C169
MTVLFQRHFQTCYLVDDVKQAMARFGENYGITKWHVMDMLEMMGEGAPARFIALAWAGDMMIELIEPDEAVPSIYQEWQRDRGLESRFHHLGFLVYSEEEFSGIKQQLVEQGFPIVAEAELGNVLKAAYMDTTKALGHFYELIYLPDGESSQFFADVPFN